MSAPPIDDHILAEIRERRNAWFRYFRSWRAVYWIVGILGVLSSVVAASRQLPDNWLSAAAGVSAVCLAVIGFTGSQRRANAYVSAWRVVGTAMLRYKGGLISLDDLISALDRGEAAITEADINRPLTSEPFPD